MVAAVLIVMCFVLYDILGQVTRIANAMDERDRRETKGAGD